MRRYERGLDCRLGVLDQTNGAVDPAQVLFDNPTFRRYNDRDANSPFLVGGSLRVAAPITAVEEGHAHARAPAVNSAEQRGEGELRPSIETRHLSDSFGSVVSDGCEPGEIDFELDRGFVAERGMQSGSIIDVFDEGAYVGSGFLDRGVGLGVHFLLLQGSHEALGLGVVVRVAGPAHAGSDRVGLQPFAVFIAGVLYAAVGVVDETGRGTAGRQRHVERLDSQTRPEMVGQRPADHPRAATRGRRERRPDR